MKSLIFILFFLFNFSVFSQDRVNTNLFGFRTSLSFIFFDTKSSSFISDVQSLSPNVLSFPGGLGNFYHYDGIGYGLKLDEIKKYQNHNSRNQIVKFFNDLIISKNHNQNYIYDFISMAKETNSSVIFDANIITSTPDEVLRAIKTLVDSNVSLLGIELGGELYDKSYSHFMTIDKYINLSKLYANSIRSHYKDIPIGVVSAPHNRGSIRLSEWNRRLALEKFYDAIIIHPYAKVVKGRDVAGQMLTVISEGVDDVATFDIYKERAIKYIILDFKREIKKYNHIFKNRRIWLTEWNLQMSQVTGNTLLQALFVSHQLIELASLSESNIDLATFHNLAGRTISGSMIRKKDSMVQKNATYNSMKIINELFKDTLFLMDKKKISDDCFEYCFISKEKDRKLYYWINWSKNTVGTQKKVVGNLKEYFGDQLFSKNTNSNTFSFNSIDNFDSEVYLKPYSITFVNEIIIK